MLRTAFLLTCAIGALTTTEGSALGTELLLPELPSGQQECRFEAERSGTVPLAGARMLIVEAGAGSLRIEGRPGLDEVRVHGRACASDRSLLDQLDFDAASRSGAVEVRTREVRNRSWTGRQYARLDLTIEVPAGMEADIVDNSGEMVVMGLGDTRIDDGSGEIDVQDMGGSLTIEDGSGEIRIRDIEGDVTIDDGSGEIELLRIAGSIRIDDGSGDIDADDVGGNFIVVDGGSGSIDYHAVRGTVDIPRKHRRR